MSESHVLLYVEDDPSTAEFMTRRLKALGFEVLHAASLERARTFVESGGFCLVLLDLEIRPDEGPSEPLIEAGTTLLSEIRARYPWANAEGKRGLQVIVLSGNAGDPESRDMVYQTGADAVITKPLLPKDTRLKSTIERCLEWSDRRGHANCARVDRESRRAQRDVSAAPVRKRLVLTARTEKQRTIAELDGDTVALTVRQLRVLLALAFARLKADQDGGDGSVVLTKLGRKTAKDDRKANTAYKAISEARERFAPLLARQGLPEIIVPNRDGSYCLHPSFAPVIDREGLSRHRDATIRRLLAEEKRADPSGGPSSPGTASDARRS